MSGTPRKPTNTSDTTNLDAKRTSLTSIAGDIPECPLKYFLDSLLPALPANAPTEEQIKQKLKIKSQWPKKFKFPEPKDSLVHEDETFETLSTVFNDINEVCNPTRQPVLKMVNTPHQAPRGEEGSEPAHRTRPDACLLLRATRSVVQNTALRWSDVAMTWEYKKKRKITRAATIFGLTIENVGFKIWFCDRSGYIVSERIRYLDSDSIISVFARLLLATEEELGYDMSVTRVLDQNKPQYNIRVDSSSGARVFRTKSVLADYSADRVVGRATRVWEVYEIYDGGGGDPSETLALKDSWVERPRPREGDTYKLVMENTTPGEREYFLTPVCHGDVKLASGDLDITLATRRGTPPSESFSVMERLHRSFSRNVVIGAPKRLLPHQPKPVVKPRPFAERMHYRIVFKEVGIPLFELTNLGDIWQALCDANEALIIMQKKEYIHRDISGGNILFYNNRGRLSDLEFSARYDPNADTSGTHDVLTGTADFMSAELFAHDCLYLPMRHPKFGVAAPTTSPFLQNFLHDAESLWWVALWCLARLNPVNRNLSQDEAALSRRVNQYCEWFPPLQAQKHTNAFNEDLRGRPPKAFTNAELPEDYSLVWKALGDWRTTVTAQIYATQFVQGDINPDGMEDLHVKTRDVINTQELINNAYGVGHLKVVVGSE